MKNACLIFTKGSFENVCLDVPLAFERRGYEFTELRFLKFWDESTVVSLLKEYQKTQDNLVVIAYGFAPYELQNAIKKGFKGNFLPATAYGSGILDEGEKTLFLLGEADCEYADEVCVPHLENKYGRRIGKIVLRLVGTDGERLRSVLSQAKAMCAGRVKLAAEERFGECVLRIFYDDNTPRMLTDDLLRFLTERLGDNLYAMDDTPLERQLVTLLKLRRKKIAVAESFTGGGLAKKIVSVSGASEVYEEGLNTNSEASKMARLAVTEYTLRSQGAVSEQTAYEMAAGLLQQGRCDVAIATTGLAGPKDDGSGLPIGTCCIAVGIDQNVYVYRYVLQGNREEITETAIRYALFLACKQLKNM